MKGGHFFFCFENLNKVPWILFLLSAKKEVFLKNEINVFVMDKRLENFKHSNSE
jgi:hypothetical protein